MRLVAPEALRESALQRRMVAAAAKTITGSFGQAGGRKLAAWKAAGHRRTAITPLTRAAGLLFRP